LFLEVPTHEKHRDDNGDHQADKIIHTAIFSQGCMIAAAAMDTCAETGKHCFPRSRQNARF
jgi:hypothetical protein